MSERSNQANLVYALHASASSPRQWQTLRQALSPSYCLEAPDLPGYGAANHDRRTTRSLARRAQVLLAEIEKSGTPVHLVGHSFGGALALKLCAMRPDLVKSLTLFEPIVPALLRYSPSTEDKCLFCEFQVFASFVTSALACNSTSTAMETFIDFWSGPGSWSDCDSQLRQHFSANAATVGRDFGASLRAPWPRTALARIEQPVSVMVGGRSPFLARRMSERLVTLLPKARLTELEDCDHLAPISAPARINALILSHLAETEGEPARPFKLQAEAA